MPHIGETHTQESLVSSALRVTPHVQVWGWERDGVPLGIKWFALGFSFVGLTVPDLWRCVMSYSFCVRMYGPVAVVTVVTV
mgnify:CR=1 FL=1